MTNKVPLSKISNQRLWLYAIGLLAFWTIVFASAADTPRATTIKTSAAPSPPMPAPTTTIVGTAPVPLKGTAKEKELSNARNCKALCGHCGCMGFYCGEECICECNNEHSDTECIATMQMAARKLRIPFELLIQGPTANRFVRNALQFEQNAERVGAILPGGRNKRSNVVIYKPLIENSLGADAATAIGDRHKRSLTPHLEWFSDFANTLVRPAPLGGAPRKIEEPVSVDDSTAQQKRSANEMDHSWFMDTANRLIRPSPLFKRPQDSVSAEKFAATSEKLVDEIPRVIKDTIRSIQEGALTEDFTDALRTNFRQGTEVLQNTLQSNFDFMARNRDRSGQAFDDALRPKAPLISQDAAPKFIIPWFRPARFLRRVQQAIV